MDDEDDYGGGVPPRPFDDGTGEWGMTDAELEGVSLRIPARVPGAGLHPAFVCVDVMCFSVFSAVVEIVFGE